MDGFNTNETVIVIGATNRLDLLDEALLRPGRFDRHIYIGNPNMRSREQILEVHTKKQTSGKKTVDIKGIEKNPWSIWSRFSKYCQRSCHNCC